MAIKRFNSVVDTVERPLRLSDIQHIWTALNQVFDNGDFRVIAGLNYDDASGTLSKGIASYKGQLYYYGGGGNIRPNTILYYGRIEGSTRIFANGNSYPFDFDYIISATQPAQESGILLPASRNNAEYLESKRLGAVGVGTITNDKLAQASVTSDKLDASIAPAHLVRKATRAFTNRLLALSVSDFIFPDARLDGHIQTQYVEVTTTATDGAVNNLSVTGAAIRNQKIYPENLTLVIKPPCDKELELSINGSALDSTTPISVVFKTTFYPIFSVDGAGVKPYLIICHLKKITESDYVVVNTYLTTSFELPF